MGRSILLRCGALLAALLLVGSCSDDGGSEEVPPTEGEDAQTEEMPTAIVGTWDVAVPGSAGAAGPFELCITGARPGDEAGSWLAAGCMGRSGSLAPAAVFVSESVAGPWEIIITATLDLGEIIDVAPVVELSGPIELNGPGPGDDHAGGPDALVRWEDGELAGWTAIHLSADTEPCPAVVSEGGLLSLFHNLSAHIHIVDGERRITTNFVTETNIVSSGVLLTPPGGETMLLQPNTDIFTPWVDFVTDFRFEGGVAGFPTVGEPYGFVLLDALGEPLAGTQREDVWERCEVEPPTDFVLEVLDDGSLRVSWTPSEPAFGFDPENAIGVYQVQVRAPDGEMVAGAETDRPEHVLPWEDFGGEAPGDPSGFSYGAGLGDLENGTYFVGVGVYAQDWNDPHASTACRVENRDEGVSVSKSEEGISVP
jgi:hypothetical protein